MTKICLYCNIEFSFYKGNNKCCSKECTVNNRNKLAREMWHTRDKHRPEVQAARHRSYLKHKDKYLAGARKWYWNNRERRNKIRRKWELKQYGITIEQYEEMYQNQEGKCLICLSIDKRGYTLAVDHNHTTNVVRGLLCGCCNRAIGLVKDSSDILKRMIIYLESEAPL